MKILLVCSGYVNQRNPVLSFAYDQALGLLKNGHEVKFLIFDGRFSGKSKKIGFYHKAIKEIEVCGFAFPINLFPPQIGRIIKKRVNFYTYKHFKLDEWNPDIIHAHFGVAAFGAIDIVRKSKVDFFITEHYSKMNSLSPDKIVFEESVQSYKYAKKLFAVSRFLKNNLEATTGLQFSVIPNVINPIFHDIEIEKNRSNDSKIHFVSAGSLIKSKRFDFLVEALSNLDKDSFDLEIYGSGIEESSIRALIMKKGLQDNIYLKGYASKEILAKAYSKADVFILLSETETFGVVYIEAMACGLPVISTECGGTDDFITDNNGIIIKTTDAKCVSDEIKAFISNIHLYDKNAIREEAISKFSTENVMRVLTSEYEY